MSGRRRGTAKPAVESTLLVFTATWSPPSVLLGKTLDALEADGVTVTRVDVDADDVTAERFRVISVPTVVVLRGEQERRRFLGAVSATDLRDALRRR